MRHLTISIDDDLGWALDGAMGGPPSAQCVLQAILNQCLRLPDDPLYELVHGWHIVNEPLYLSSPVDSRIQVAGLQQLATTAASH